MAMDFRFSFPNGLPKVPQVEEAIPGGTNTPSNANPVANSETNGGSAYSALGGKLYQELETGVQVFHQMLDGNKTGDGEAPSGSNLRRLGRARIWMCDRLSEVDRPQKAPEYEE